jgi:hypothetical protein
MNDTSLSLLERLRSSPDDSSWQRLTDIYLPLVGGWLNEQKEEELKREPGETILRYSALNPHGSRANLLGSLGRHGEAIADWSRVIELNDEPADRAAYRLSRIMALLRTNDYARGVAGAQELARDQSSKSPPSGADLYNFACVFGLAADAGQNDNRLDAAERKRRHDAYAGSALDWLKRATATGFFDDPKNRDHARQDSDLASLHDNAEFSNLLRVQSP